MSSLRTCPACVRVWSGIPALFGALLILLPMCSVRGRVHAEAPRFLLRGWWKGKAAPGVRTAPYPAKLFQLVGTLRRPTVFRYYWFSGD